MSTLHEAVVEAFKALGGIRTIDEIRDWVETKYGARWKDFGTRMADMVPQEFGGNLSSNVPNEFRVLAKVEKGKYRLTENSIVQEKSTSNVSHEVPISASDTEKFQPSSKSIFYSVLSSINSVEVWSTERLSFEPKGLLKRLRTDICSAVKGICCGSEKILHATYVSPIIDRCDVENILFYNVGTACFHQVDKSGLRFERVFSQLPKQPQQMKETAMHYHSYKPEAEEADFKHWVPTKTLVRWRTLMHTRFITQLSNPAYIWYCMKNGTIELLYKPQKLPEQFGLKMKLRAPQDSVSSLTGLLKPLLDGTVASFHHDDTTLQTDIVARVACTLNGNKQKVVALLNDNTHSVLGKRRLLWSRKNGVQWNPADDYCVACELLSKYTPDGFVEYSGELFEVREIKHFSKNNSHRTAGSLVIGCFP